MTTSNLTATDAKIRAQSVWRRHAAVRARMTERDIDVLVAYGSGLHAFTGTNPCWYLSAYKPIGPHSAVILPLAGDPVLILTPHWDAARYRERATMEFVATDPRAFFDAVEAELDARNWKGKSIAVAGGPLQPQAVRETWPALLGAEPIDADALISDMAKIRDEWSLKCVRRAVAIAERGYEHLLETTHAGMREHEVAAHLELFMRELGAEDNFQLLSSSQHNQAGHLPTDRMLEQGDVLLAEITPAVEGEFVQICRSAVLGEPTAVQREKYALLATALAAGMRAATPGTSVTDIVAAINAPIAAAGYERYTKPPYMRTRGHSLGLGSMEPEIAPGLAHVMAEDMVFVMHPNQYLPETGYLMCGEPVRITRDGAVALTSRRGELGAIL